MQDLDTVLGLSIAPTTVGWVILDGSHPEAAVLARGQFGAGRRRGTLDAADTATRTESVLRLREMVEGRDRLLHGIGVTWSADAAAEAAVLMESLTAAGCDNVVPVRYRSAAALSGGQMFGQAEAQLASARRAAMAVTSGMQFSAPQPERTPLPLDDVLMRQPRSIAYAGAVAMLVGGLVTFVVSLSTALSLQLPAKDRPAAAQMASAPAIPSIGRGAAPAGAPLPVDASRPPAEAPPAEAPPADAPPPEAPPPEAPPADAPPPEAPPEDAPPPPPPPPAQTPETFGSLGESPPAASAAAAPPASGPRSLLNRVLAHLPHLHGH